MCGVILQLLFQVVECGYVAPAAKVAREFPVAIKQGARHDVRVYR